MQEEISKIITMVEEGKLASDEASALIAALKEGDQEGPVSAPEKGYLKKHLKVRIHSGEKENVRVNIPLRFVKWLLKTGHGIATSIPEAKAYADDINLDDILYAIDHGFTGNIIDLDTEEGERIVISIE